MVIGWIGGFFYHEALDEKIRYERDSCIIALNDRNREAGWREFEMTHTSEGNHDKS